MFRKITIGVLVCVVAATVQATDYCNLKSCHTSHIACNNSGEFGPKCPARVKIIDILPYISEIVDFHNERRNWIAGGCEDGYLPAKRMATMQWDNELATIAAYSVKLCYLEAEKCRNTETFEETRTNVASNSYYGEVDPHKDKDVIDEILSYWWDEYKICNKETIKKFEWKSPGDFFTIMVRDKNIRIGCAASRYPKDIKWTTVLLVCNYASNNVIGGATYVTGKTASKCKTGTNPKYPNLCSVHEVYTDM